jgi:hypothetical protein
MKRFGKIAVGLAAGLALNAGLCLPNSPVPRHPPVPRQPLEPRPAPREASSHDLLSGNPYAVIAERNVFGLVPLTPVTATTEDPSKDLPKIAPEGIMGYFGNLQVLFKVAPAKPDPKAKEEYYTLSEGQMQDDIEVVKIDDANSMVTFNNHGTTQELPLVETSNSGRGAPTGRGGVGGVNHGAAPGFRANNGRGTIIPFGARVGGPNGGPMNGATGFNGGPGTGMNSGNSSLKSHIYQPPASTLTPQQAAVLIEAQRAKLLETPANQRPYSPNILPTTPLTQYNTTDNNGPPAP